MFIAMRRLGSIFWRGFYPYFASLSYHLIDLLPSTSAYRRWKEYRKTNSGINFPAADPEKHILLFCPSLGEYESVKSIIYEIKSENPDAYIEITFFSPSGYFPLSGQFSHEADMISYSPPDTRKLVKEFFNARRVSYVIISGLTIWPNFLQFLIASEIGYCFIAARIKKGWFKNVYLQSLAYYLEQAQFIFCLDTISQTILSSQVNTDRIILAGDPRIDSIIRDVDNPPTLIEKIENFKNEYALLILGSTHPEDEIIILPHLKKMSQEWRIIIAPHDVSRALLLREKLENSILFSNYTATDDQKILILDSIGLLKYTYSYATLTYIGGGFNKGLHNIEEPLLAGSVVIVGKDVSASYLAPSMISKGLLFQIRNSYEFGKLLEKFSKKKNVKKLSKDSFDHIKKLIGATKIIMKFLKF